MFCFPAIKLRWSLPVLMVSPCQIMGRLIMAHSRSNTVGPLAQQTEKRNSYLLIYVPVVHFCQHVCFECGVLHVTMPPEIRIWKEQAFVHWEQAYDMQLRAHFLLYTRAQQSLGTGITLTLHRNHWDYTWKKVGRISTPNLLVLVGLVVLGVCKLIPSGSCWIIPFEVDSSSSGNGSCLFSSEGVTII